MRILLASALYAALGLLLSAAFVRWALPLRTLSPDGARGVAHHIWTWTDTTRRDPLSARPEQPRRLKTQVLYPSAPPFRSRLPTDAPLPSEPAPVVVIVHGSLGTYRSHNSLGYQLASDGFFVVAADHGGIALFTDGPGVLPRVPPAGVRAILAETVHMPAGQRLSRRATDQLLDVLTDDALFLAERAHRVLRLPDGPRAYLGHGLGGLAALGACERDPSCRTTIVLDASPSLADHPITRPCLAVRSGAFVDRAPPDPADALIVHLDLDYAGALDLTDTPLQVRGTLLRSVVSRRHSTPGGGQALYPLRAAASAWLSTHLDRGDHPLESAVAPWPEARLSSARP